MSLGYHISLSKFNSFEDAVKQIKEHKATVIQIFLSNPRTGKIKEREEDYYKKMGKILKKNKIDCYIHSSYTINLAKDWDKYSWWIITLIKEFHYANLIGAKGVVVHFGKKLDLLEKQALNNMFSSIAYILNQTEKYNVEFLLETTAGQGTELCSTLPQLGKFFKKIKLLKNKRIGIVIDSCHIFAAGYNIKQKSGFEMYLDNFEEIVGLKYVKLIHLNDSKKKCGSRLDRHANIGEGEIGLKPLLRFYRFFNKLKIPIILETPSGKYKEEIKKLKNS